MDDGLLVIQVNKVHVTFNTHDKLVPAQQLASHLANFGNGGWWQRDVPEARGNSWNKMQ